MAEWGIIIRMYYVYILKSLKDDSRYIGITKDLKNRISEHNNLETKSNKKDLKQSGLFYLGCRAAIYRVSRYKVRRDKSRLYDHL